MLFVCSAISPCVSVPALNYVMQNPHQCTITIQEKFPEKEKNTLIYKIFYIYFMYALVHFLPVITDAATATLLNVCKLF